MAPPNIPNAVRVTKLSLYNIETGNEIELPQSNTVIKIVEDIFSGTISGFVAFEDAFDKLGLDKAEFGGHEKIEIEWRSPEYITQASCKFEGRVVKCSTDFRIQEGLRFYVLHFVSIEHYKDSYKTISRVYSGKRLDEYVKKIIEDDLEGKLPDENIEKTKEHHQHKIVVPFWSPLQLVNWISARSIPKDGDASLFFCWQSLGLEDGAGGPEFHFKSLEKLFKDKKSNSKVKKIGYNYIKQLESPPENLLWETVQAYERINFMDVMKSVQDGMYSQAMWMFDITKMKWGFFDGPATYPWASLNYKSRFEAIEDHGGDLHLPYKTADKEELIGAEYVSRFKNYPVHTGIHYSKDTPLYSSGAAASRWASEWAMQRTCDLAAIDNIRYKVMLPGDSTRRAGDVIEFEVPSFDSSAQGTNKDLLMSGHYIVTSVAHVIDNRNPASPYSCVCELSRDALTKIS